MLIDIVILPPESIRAKVGKKISFVAKNYPHNYVVDNIKLIPHLSLFHLRILKSKLDKLEQMVETVVGKYKSFQLKSVGFVKYDKDLVLQFRISKPATLSKLNRDIIQRCHKFRTGELLSWYKDYPFPRLDKLYIKKYGSYWSTGKNFDPHFTMVKYKFVDDGSRMTKKMGNFGFKFLADTVAVCEINKHGQVIKILKKFKLKA
jgi:2'-5' RNA ligase